MFGRRGFRFGKGCGDFRIKMMRRGDIKFLLLETLKDNPLHGYEIINEMERRSGGYRPSPGSVYPTLQMLEEGGYLTSEQVDGKKVYSITDSGRQLLEERGKVPFEVSPEMEQVIEVKKSFRKLASAVTDGVRDADEETIKRISEVVDKARRDVYSILAES